MTGSRVGAGSVALVEESPWRWRIERSGDMRVPGVVFASVELLPEVSGDQSLRQVVNVATLPGIVEASYAMPDVHWGYGFPIGGVAATDVSHNLAKLETHRSGGGDRLLCVHRKGATRALPPGHPELPADLADAGQPVLVPGSMGTASYVLAGAAGSGAFHSTCHGAGRRMSRTASKRSVSGARLRTELAGAGVEVRAGSDRGLAEEAPLAYKDVDAVVDTVERAGLARRVARLVPLGVLKG